MGEKENERTNEEEEKKTNFARPAFTPPPKNGWQPAEKDEQRKKRQTCQENDQML